MLTNIRRRNYFTYYNGFNFSSPHDRIVLKEGGFELLFDVGQRNPIFSLRTFEEFINEVTQNRGGMGTFLSTSSNIRVVCDIANYRKASYYFIAQLNESYALSDEHLSLLINFANGNFYVTYNEDLMLSLQSYKDYKASLSLRSEDIVYQSPVDIPFEDCLFLNAYGYMNDADFSLKIQSMENYMIESASAQLSKAISAVFGDTSLVQDLTGSAYSGNIFDDLAQNEITDYLFVNKAFYNTDGSFELSRKTGIVNLVTTINAKSKESASSEELLNPELENILDAFNGTFDLNAFMNPAGMDFMEYSFWNYGEKVNFIQILHSIRKRNE